MWRVSSLMCLCVALASLSSVRSNPRGSRPHIVVFIVDDLGYGDVGFLGNTTIPTPNIDRIAEEGVKMTHLHAAAAICTPSRAAFLTGRYPIRSGMSGLPGIPVIMVTPSSGGLQPQEVTFAELAKEAGYKTALIGKWHLGLHRNIVGDSLHSPINQGFDYWFGIPLTNIHDFDEEEIPGLLRVYPKALIIANTTILAAVFVLFLLYRKGFIKTWHFVVLTLVTFCTIRYHTWMGMNIRFINSMLYRNSELVEQPIQFTGLTKRLVSEGNGFLRENYREDGPPLLLYMSWLQVHTALHAGPAFQGKSKHGRYGDEVMEMDWSVGEILKTLDKLGIKEDTLVFFTSDNGGHSDLTGKTGAVEGGYNGPLAGAKTQGGMDGGTRVPTAVRWPRYIKPGQTLDVPLSQMDLFPTVAEITGVPIPHDRIIDGKSLLPLLLGERVETQHDHLIHYCTDKIHAVRFKPDQEGRVWKVRYTTPNWLPGTYNCQYICFCVKDHTYHDTPLVFDITNNIKEDKPLSVTDPRHGRLVQAAAEVIKQHQAGIGSVQHQVSFFNRLFKPHLMPCCNFPYCTCKDPKYFPS